MNEFPPPDHRKTPDPTPPRPPGTIPDHQLLHCIGRGSYGEVWLARNMMGQFRAIKIVDRKSFKDDRPFERELSGIRKFEPISRSHEGFIDILQVGINQTLGYFYYVMEVGDDQSLGAEIQPETYSPKTLSRNMAQGGRFSLQECLELGLAISLALHELHKNGLVHRDVKPSNIIFVNGVPKLADIGLVAEVEEARSYVGTEGFIPPEGPGNPQADIYSLGKTLYEVSTGKDRHDFPALPTLLDDIPDRAGFLELNEIMLKACKNDLAERYQSAWEMHADLVVLAAGKSVKRLRVLERRLANVKRVAGLAALTLIILSGIFYPIYQGRKTAAEARQQKVGAKIAYGNRAMEAGDLLGALPNFADALSLDGSNSKQQMTHRVRLASVLAQCPKLTWVRSAGSEVEDGEFSPDGSTALLAESGGKIELWDAWAGTMNSHVFKSANYLWGASFSPDGQMIVTASDNGLAMILKTGSLEEVGRLPHPRQIFSAKFSPDGLRVITGCGDGSARVWNWKTLEVVFSLQHGRGVRMANFSPDGRFIATASEDGTAGIWNAQNGEILRFLPHHQKWVYTAAFSPDGTRVVTACGDHKARVWDVDSGRQVYPEMEHGDAVESAEFSPDGKLIVTASLDGTARLWRADTLTPLSVTPILWHGERLTHAAICGDGHRILTTGTDGTVRIWDLAGSLVEPLAVPRLYSKDGSRAASFTNGGVEIDDVLSGRLVGPLIGMGAPVAKAELNANGRFIATVTKPDASGTATLQVSETATGANFGPAISISNAAVHFAMSMDGKRLVTYAEKTAQSWDVPTGKPLSETLQFPQTVRTAVLNPDGSRFATTSGRGAQVWDSVTGHPCFPPLEFSSQVHYAEFSPDGSRLVAACTDSSFAKCYAQVWEMAGGHPIGARLQQGDGVLVACFSPDGTHVVTASEDFTAIVWDAATGQQITPPILHQGQVQGAAFSPDGRWFVTASTDNTAQVWNSETGDPLTPPLQHLAELTSAIFLSDGHHIVTRDAKEKSRFWALPVENRPTDDLVSLARLLSGSTETRFGRMSSEPSGSWETAWKRLRAQYPSTFETSAEEIEHWYEFQAESCDLARQWQAVVFHLSQLLKIHPGDPLIGQRIATANQHLKAGD